MNSTRKLMALAVSMAFAGSAAAQPGPSTGAGDSPRGTASPSITAPTGGVSPASSATHELKATRLSKLRGVNIYDNNAKKIGEVADVVIDPATGRILHTIVSIGGVMGIGDKEHAVPTKQLRVFSRSADDAVPVKVELSGGSQSLPRAEKLDKDSPYLLGSRLVGLDINDGGGKEIGEVEDLVLDLQAGEAKYALVDFVDSWGGDDKLFAIPVAELKRNRDSRNLVLNVTKESLAQRPSMDEARLDKMDLSAQPWMQAAGGAAGASPAGAPSTAGSGGSAGSMPAGGSDAGSSTATGSRTPPSAGPGGTPPAGSAGGSQPAAGAK
ncbi:MAG: PRC-barrel domain-containing protein [Lautropia sp.]|nr:PRC-barrel domain-containing protein [Lautropia sp.]